MVYFLLNQQFSAGLFQNIVYSSCRTQSVELSFSALFPLSFHSPSCLSLPCSVYRNFFMIWNPFLGNFRCFCAKKVSMEKICLPGIPFLKKCGSWRNIFLYRYFFKNKFVFNQTSSVADNAYPAETDAYMQTLPPVRIKYCEFCRWSEAAETTAAHLD